MARGGAERVALLIASGLLDRGHRSRPAATGPCLRLPREVPAGVRLFFLSHSGDTKNRSDLDQLPITPRPLIQPPLPIYLRFPRLALGAALNRDQLTLLASNRLPRWAAALAAYLDRERPDAVLATLTPAVAVATMAVRLAHHPVRTVAQAAGVLRSRRDIRRARRSYPHADAAVGVSQGISNKLAKIPGMSGDRVQTVYNPVLSADLLRNAREPAGHLWLDETGPPAVLAIGRLHKVKDFPILLAAFARFLARRRRGSIVLGKGPQLSDLLSLAHELRISGTRRLSGFVKNPYAFLARARLFVLSSRSEGLANVLIEAMACGCPVVSTDCPFGPREIFGGWTVGRTRSRGRSESPRGSHGPYHRRPPPAERTSGTGGILQRRACGQPLRGASPQMTSRFSRLAGVVSGPDARVASSLLLAFVGAAAGRAALQCAADRPCRARLGASGIPSRAAWFA